MTFKEFQEANAKRAAHSSAWFTWSLAEQTNAMCGEAGEAANITKKLLRGDGEVNEKLIQELAKELADVVTYAALVASALGVDLGEVAREKFNEVSARWGVEDRL